MRQATVSPLKLCGGKLFESVVHQAWQGEAANEKFGSIIDHPQFYGAVTPPTSGMDLLRNAKWALDHNALLRVDFFTPQNMKRFMGTAAPVFRFLDRIEVRWEFKPSASELASLPTDVAAYAKCIYGANRYQETDGSLKQASLYFECNYQNRNYPTFDEVVKVFGNEWWPGWEVFGPPSHGWPSPATAPHGNDEMVYDFEGVPYRDGLARRRALVGFLPDASFKSFSLAEGVMPWR
jgi:hypothetical protein